MVNGSATVGTSSCDATDGSAAGATPHSHAATRIASALFTRTPHGAAATQRGFRKLLATIRADNPYAVLFYRRLGFRVIGIAADHARVEDRYVDEILLERPLDAENARDTANR